MAPLVTVSVFDALWALVKMYQAHLSKHLNEHKAMPSPYIVYGRLVVFAVSSLIIIVAVLVGTKDRSRKRCELPK